MERTDEQSEKQLLGFEIVELYGHILDGIFARKLVSKFFFCEIAKFCGEHEMRPKIATQIWNFGKKSVVRKFREKYSH